MGVCYQGGIRVVELHAAGKGKIDVITMVNGAEIRGTFHNILCAQPKSQPFLHRNSYRIWRGSKLQGNKVYFCKDDIIIMVGERVVDSIYSLRGTLVNCKQGENIAAGPRQSRPQKNNPAKRGKKREP